MIVLDASAAVELLIRTPAAMDIERRILRPEETIHAPHLIDLEVAQVFRRSVAARQMSEQKALAALSEYLNVRIVRHRHDDLLPRVWGLRANMTAYDAVYVALAEALSAPLITCDLRLARTKGHQASIEVVGRES